MFVRTKQQRNGKVSILIVENVRTAGNVCQKTLRHVATVLANEVDRFMELAEHIRAEMEVSRVQNLSCEPNSLKDMVMARLARPSRILRYWIKKILNI